MNLNKVISAFNNSSINNIKEILVYPVSEKGMIGTGERYEVRGDEPEEIEDFFNERIIGAIPEDRSVRAAIQHMAPVVMHAPRSGAAKAYNKLAMHIAGVKQRTFADVLFDFLSADRKPKLFPDRKLLAGSA